MFLSLAFRGRDGVIAAHAGQSPLPPARNRPSSDLAIIAHPDAGKTTLTEKFLLFGGAIQMAGCVRAKGEARRTRSDFIKMEQERGDFGLGLGHVV